MRLTALCERSGGWWAVTVPEVAGLHTQAKRLDQIEAMVLDAAALLTGDPEESFDVELAPVLAPAETELVASAKAARVRLRDAEAETAELSREAAARLAGQGLTLREIGTVLDVSPQWAHKLLKTA
jgi:predicted RNase H-like HicB family nuclease